jgi:hypothetical protein
MNLAIWLLDRAKSAKGKVRHPIFKGVRDDLY